MMADEPSNIDFITQLNAKYTPIIVEEAPEPTLNYDIHGPRLIITKIVNENFKSYSGVRVLGPFHKNFTCVIGPNGSGKSNLIDALLFVFGFRASKIRSKKLNVLIHKSEYYPNISSCTVKVYFQRIKSTGEGDQDFEIIPNSDFIVSRTAYKDNTSILRINDKKASTKEVTDFLKKQGIDLDHNRFLILQGEVEQIALMKPKASTEYEDGLLEYLEDIIGSHRFKEPLQILFKRLEELCELRSEKLNRVKVVGKEKKDLEGVRNEAVKYLRLCNEIVIRKNISFQLKLRDLNLLEETAVEKQNEVKAELDQILADIEKVNQLRLEKEKDLKQTTRNHLMKSQQFEVNQKKFQDLEIEDAELRDRRKHCRAKLDEISKTIKLKEKEIIKYQNVPDESIGRIKELSDEIENLEELKSKEVANQERAQSLLKEETQVLQKTKDQKMDELRKYQELLQKQEAEIAAKKISLDLLIGNYKKEEEAYRMIETQLKTIREKIEEHEAKCNKYDEDIPKMEKEYQKTIEEIAKLREIEKKTKLEVEQLFHALQSGKNTENEYKVISFLMSQQSLGKLKGVVGRLGNLCAIDPKYDVAVSTACGRLDSIITEDINDAQKCVELMKVNNISRSAFIGLNKVKIWEKQANQKFNANVAIPRAFDLLTIPNKDHRAVFYFSFRDLLISVDIREAKKVNERGAKYRIVTLKGELIEIHGAMTGGGNRQIKGKICTDVNKIRDTIQTKSSLNVDPKILEQSYNKKEQELNDILQQLSNLTDKSEMLKNHISMAHANKNNLRNILKNLNIDEVENRKELVILENKLKANKPDANAVKLLETTIEKLNKKYEKDSEGVDSIKKDIQKINDEIKSFGIAKLTLVKSRIDTIVNTIKEKSDTLRKINMAVKNAEKLTKRITTDLEQLKLEKTKQEDSFKEMDVTLKLLEKKAEETLAEYQKTNEEVNELLKLKEEQSLAISKVNEDLQKSKQIQLQISRDYDEKKAMVDQIRMRIKQMQDDIKKLTLYSLPEGVEEDLEDTSFMDLIGESSDGVDIFSSQKDSHTGTTLKVYSHDDLVKFKNHQITYQDMEDKLNKQKPNLAAIEEYRMKEELYMQRASELNEVTQLRDQQRDQLEKMKRQRHQEFTAGFNLITTKLKEMYQMITMGGDAELELVDSLDPFSEGILFSVRPPKKSWKNISNLSGGEKTLSSLALVFALHHFKPTPFYVMDEIDAALDFKNVSIVANYIKERTKNAQFIIISLRNNMYELANSLVGIDKPFNYTKTCLTNPNALSWTLKNIVNMEKNLKETQGTSSQPKPTDYVQNIIIE